MTRLSSSFHLGTWTPNSPYSAVSVSWLLLSTACFKLPPKHVVSGSVKCLRKIFLRVLRVPPVWLLPFWDVPQFLPALWVPNPNFWCLSPVRFLISAWAQSSMHCTYWRVSLGEKQTGMALTQCGFFISRFIYLPASAYFIHSRTFKQLFLWFIQSL